MDNIVRAFRNNSGIRVPMKPVGPDKFGGGPSSGSAGGGRQVPMPGTEGLRTKSEYLKERDARLLKSFTEKQNILKEKNAILREAKKGNDLTKIANAERERNIARDNFKKTKRNMRDVKRGKVSWGKKEYE